MTDVFFRFPHTPHLAWLGSASPRSDKVMSIAEAEAFLANSVVVEEKVDGANLGFSKDESGRLRAQNRGHYLEQPYRGQFSKLSPWLEVHGDQLLAAVRPGWVVFGEWCATRHSLTYDRLPDWWLLFDIYESNTGTFQNAASRNDFALALGLSAVRELYRGKTSLHELKRLLAESTSQYGPEPVEGLVVRSESASGTQRRAKLVRPDFTQAIEAHWRSRHIEWNRLAT